MVCYEEKNDVLFSFRNHAPVVWNNIDPGEIQSINSLNTFKRKLNQVYIRTYIFTALYILCSVCVGIFYIFLFL